MAQEKSIEVKVGVLILVSLMILGGFVMVMGGVSFERKYTLYVMFDNPGGLQTGAHVRLAGIQIGKVEKLEFANMRSPQSGKNKLVKVTARVEQKYQSAIRDDAEFFITAQGVLGEQFLAISPGSPDKPALPAESIRDGIDPPRLDLFLAKAYDLLDTTISGLRDNKDLILDIANNTRGLIKGLNGTLSDNRERIDRIVQNTEALTEEAKLLTHNARMNYVDNPKMHRTIDNVEYLTTQIRRDTGPMLKEAREALTNLNRLSSTVGDPKEQAKIRKTLEEVASLATRANAMAADAQTIVTHIKSGKGTVGALVMEEEIYDDMQEMVRDLKHNPWKFLWRE